MPVLTAKQFEEAGNAPKTEKIAEAVKVLESVKVEEVKKRWFRVFHPDDPSGRMCTQFELSGHIVRIENGISVVPESIAIALEERGWIRGREVVDHE